MKKRIVCLFLAVLMVFGCVATLASCGSEECTNHVDANCDGKCDTEGCSATVAVEHKDTNGDSKCDKCGAAMQAAGCEHVDEDLDGYCDECDEKMEVADECDHVDEDGDGYCDECDELMDDDNEVVIDYPWSNQSLIFQMSKNDNGDELPSACERYLAGEDEDASDEIDSDVMSRNADAEYYTRVTVRYEYWPDTAEYNWGKNIDRIETQVKSGSSKDAPDMYVNFVYDMVGASLKASFANLYAKTRGVGELAGKNYFEFLDDDYDESVDNRGYMYEYMQSLTLSQHKMYVLASDYFLDMIRAFFIIPVSVKLLEDFGEPITGDRNEDGEFTLDDFYAQVEAGEWNYDLLAQYSEAVYKPAGDNSGSAWLGDERVGFAMSDGGLACSGLMYTTSVIIIHKEFDDSTNDYRYYYEEENNDLFAFCDATSVLFTKPGICIVSGKDVTQYGSSQLIAIRNRFAENHVLFGDIMCVGALEFEQYQTMKENGGFGVVPVPLYRAADPETGEVDKYLTSIHNVGRPGAIAANTTKFVECTAFLNYQSTHSSDILNTYYDYKLQYDVADGSKGTVKMLEYIRLNVRSSFDKTFEDAIGLFGGENAYNQKWLVIISAADFNIDLRGDYQKYYPSKKENLDELVKAYAEFPD